MDKWIAKMQKARATAQMTEYLPSKCQAHISNLSIPTHSNTYALFNFIHYCTKNEFNWLSALIFKTLYKNAQIKEEAKEEESMQTLVNQV
jgi:hypothetical protein